MGRAVLGIDAAWTAHHPSGVALALEDAGAGRIVAAEASYAAFLARAGMVWRQAGDERADPAALLAAAERIGGGPVTLVAVDMPMARDPIVGRRPSDLGVSRAYGGRKAATHSPSALRPGRISDELRAGFGRLGYPLGIAGPIAGGLIEVYPHPALIELSGATMRLPYKFDKRARYWPGLPDAERKARILAEWARIGQLLEPWAGGAAAAIAGFRAEGASGKGWKAQEDRIDAIVCAVVGIHALTGRTICYGDDRSAIWVPLPPGRCAQPGRRAFASATVAQ